MAEYTELPFWFRDFIAWSLRSAGIEKLPEREKEWPSFFDNTEGIGLVKRTLFYKDKNSGIFLPFKGRSRPATKGTKVGVEAHITAVEFGTTARSRQFWKDLILSGQLDGVWERYGKDKDEAAQRMALHQRFWTVPYHWVSLRNGDVLHNNQISRHTYHGNGGNGPLIGVSLEGNYPGLEKNRTKKHSGMDAFVIETARAGLRLAVTEGRNDGEPVETLYAHRQYSDGRVGDPGEAWWKEVGIPMAKELVLERKVSFKHGSGNEICNEWDPLGMVDYRGRRIVP